MSHLALREPEQAVIQVAAGTDYVQLEALLHLSKLWALEEYGHDLDVGMWAEQTAGRVSSGQWIPLIAWAGDEAVGMAQASYIDDPAARIRMGFGDHAFVKEEWRCSGAYRGIYEAIVACGRIMDVDEACIPVGATDDAGKFLKPMYESRGFHVSGHIMRRIL